MVALSELLEISFVLNLPEPHTLPFLVCEFWTQPASVSKSSKYGWLTLNTPTLFDPYLICLLALMDFKGASFLGDMDVVFI